MKKKTQRENKEKKRLEIESKNKEPKKKREPRKTQRLEEREIENNNKNSKTFPRCKKEKAIVVFKSQHYLKGRRHRGKLEEQK